MAAGRPLRQRAGGGRRSHPSAARVSRSLAAQAPQRGRARGSRVGARESRRAAHALARRRDAGRGRAGHARGAAMSSPSSPPAPVVRLIPQLADFAARRYGEAPFLLRRTDSGWQGFTHASGAAAVHAFAAGLIDLGVRPGDRVGIQSESRPEWGLAYLGILAAG